MNQSNKALRDELAVVWGTNYATTDKAVTVILALVTNHIKGALPHSKEEYDQTINDDGFDYSANERNMGYNQAIKEFETILEEVSNEQMD